jgi:hypothetical protein
MSSPISKERCISEIQRVADDLGRTPKRDEINEMADISTAPIERHFERFADAVEAAGFEPHRRKKITQDELIEELRRLDKLLNGAVSLSAIDEHSKYGSGTYNRHFEGIDRAREIAGIPHPEQSSWHRISDDVLLSELKRYKRENGRAPSKSDLNSDNDYPWSSTYANRFGSLTRAKRLAGFEVEKRKCVWPQAMLRDLRDLAEDLGRVPTKADMDQHGEWSNRLYEIRFGSWNKALREGGYEVNKKGNGEGDWEKHDYGPDWPDIRERVIEKHNSECIDCGTSNQDHLSQYGTGLHVHHLTPFSEFDAREEANEMANLRPLCASCHRVWESADGRFPEYNLKQQ